jgi:flagellar hook-basal body complex protein FliE
MSVFPVSPIGLPPTISLDSPAFTQSAPMRAVAPTSFAQMLSDGIASVDAKAQTADSMVRAFALDDSIPVHQVSFALEQARASLSLMLQVRNRMVEGYQQLMNMQL